MNCGMSECDSLKLLPTAVGLLANRATMRRDPRFIRDFREKHCVEVFCEHATTKKK